ncbi:MAG TPA: uroporphyrinogen decarboxylase family protein [Acidobacteriota bacterium]|jgi:uroporphyrinogen-III decarboxylase
MPKQMTRKQRITTAARCQQPDRVPVSPMVFPFLRKRYGRRSWEYELKGALEYDFDPIIHLICYDGPPVHNNIRFLNGNYVYEGRAYFEDMAPGISVDLHIERQKDSTLVKRVIQTPAGELRDVVRQPLITSARYSGSSLFSGIRGFWGQPERIERLVKGPEDLEKIRFLLTKPTTAELVCIRRISEAVGENGLVQVDCWSPLDEYAEYAIGLEALPDICRNDPHFFGAILELFWEYSLEMTRAYLEAGAESIDACWLACGESSGWAPQEFRTIFLPVLRQHVELAHEYGAIYDYLDEGKLNNLLPMIKDAGVDIVHTLSPPPRGDVDLTVAKRDIGGRVCLRGNLDSEGELLTGTPAQVDEAVRQVILSAGPGGGFILGCSDTISADMPEDNVQAFFHAGRKYGDYDRLGKPS